jgi:hypothetical protein
LFLLSSVALMCALGPALLADQSPESRPAAADYRFPSGSGLLLFHVRPELTTEFEAVIARLTGALDSTTDPLRRAQASSWRMYRSAEAVEDAVVYVFAFFPAVDGADYDPVKVLTEAAPAESAAWYERLRAAVIRVERMGLQTLR